MKKQFSVIAVYKIMYLLAVPCTAFAFSCFRFMMLSFMYMSASVGNRGMLGCSAWCYVVTKWTSTCAVQVL